MAKAAKPEDKDGPFYTPPTFEFEGKTYSIDRITGEHTLNLVNIIEEQHEIIGKILSKQAWQQSLEQVIQNDLKRRAEDEDATPQVGLNVLRENKQLIGEIGFEIARGLVLASKDFVSLLAGLIRTNNKPMQSVAFLKMPISFYPLVYENLAAHPDFEVFTGNFSQVLSTAMSSIKDGLQNNETEPQDEAINESEESNTALTN